MRLFRAWGKALGGYYKARPWLKRWTMIGVAGLALLAVTGQFHVQGNGLPTIFEISSLLITIGIYTLSRIFFKQDLIEEYFMACLFGIQWEIMTEPMWTYLPGKFNILVWQGKDIPLFAAFGWGNIFVVSLLASNWLGRRLFGLSPRKLLFDWRVLLCDALAIQVLGSFSEWLFGIVFQCWTYDLPAGIGVSPLGLGWEIHLGYFFIMFWYGTTMRVWKLKLEGEI